MKRSGTVYVTVPYIFEQRLEKDAKTLTEDSRDLQTTAKSTTALWASSVETESRVICS